MRVLHCPFNIGGHAAQLAAAERTHGLYSRNVVLQPARFGFPADEVLHGPFKRLELLWRAVSQFDVIHFSFGQSLLSPVPFPDVAGAFARSWREGAVHLAGKLILFRDLPLLKRLGKVVVVTYQGDDARQGDVCAQLPLSLAHVVEEGYYTPASDAAKRRNIATFARYADRIWALNPDLLHVLPSHARFLPYANVDPFVITPAPLVGRTTVRIAHAPSHRKVKGTEAVIRAVEQLRSDGLGVDLDLIENVPHDEVMRRYHAADLVIDQLVAGWYGGTAVEAMALGRPVVCFLRDQDLGYLPTAMRERLPLINATPDTLERAVRRLVVAGPATLHELGSRSRAFVETWHSPQAIACFLAQEYKAARAGLPPAEFHP